MRASQGFTLIELLVVMTILGIMLGIAVPSFRNFIGTQRAKSASYEMSTTLLFARSEAIKRNTTVTIAPASGTDWTTGWTVTTTQNGSTVTLQTQPSLDGVSVSQSPSAASIVFKGTCRPTATAKNYWTITSTSATTTTTRCVALDTAGQSTAAASTTGACP